MQEALEKMGVQTSQSPPREWIVENSPIDEQKLVDYVLKQETPNVCTVEVSVDANTKDETSTKRRKRTQFIFAAYTKETT